MHSQFRARKETPSQTATRAAAHIGRAVHIVLRPSCRRGGPDRYVVTDELFADEQPLYTVTPDGTVTRAQLPLARAGSIC